MATKQRQFSNWLGDQATSISAALAFYCAFSIAPLLVIVVSIMSWLVGAVGFLLTRAVGDRVAAVQCR